MESSERSYRRARKRVKKIKEFHNSLITFGFVAFFMMFFFGARFGAFGPASIFLLIYGISVFKKGLNAYSNNLTEAEIEMERKREEMKHEKARYRNERHERRKQNRDYYEDYDPFEPKRKNQRSYGADAQDDYRRRSTKKTHRGPLPEDPPEIFPEETLDLEELKQKRPMWRDSDLV